MLFAMYHSVKLARIDGNAGLKNISFNIYNYCNQINENYE